MKSTLFAVLVTLAAISIRGAEDAATPVKADGARNASQDTNGTQTYTYE